MKKAQEKKNIILIGYMGTGKSTLGRKAAKALGYRFIDTDVRIEEEEGSTISEMFSQKGEEYFRRCETDLLKRLETEPGGMILATGGGLPMRQENAACLKRLGVVIYLKASVETLIERLQGDTKRPLLSEGDLRDKIEAMLKIRGPVYEALADFCLETDRMTFYEMISEMEKMQEN